MALTSTTSDSNLFDDDLDDADLDQIFNITDTSRPNLEQNDANDDEKMDSLSESDNDTVYIEMGNDEEDEEASQGSQILVKPAAEEDRASNGSGHEHDYSRRTTPENEFRNDELEYSSFDEAEDDIAMNMSQEIVATQCPELETEVIETSEVQDVENYGDPELQVNVLEEKIPDSVKVPKKLEAVDSQASDTSYNGVPNIFNSTISTEMDFETAPEDDTDSQKTIILSDSLIQNENEKSKAPVEIASESLETQIEVPNIEEVAKNEDFTTVEAPKETENAEKSVSAFISEETFAPEQENSVSEFISEETFAPLKTTETPETSKSPEKPKSITDPVPSTSKEHIDDQLNNILLPAELTETRQISQDHDYLAKKLPMNFNLVVEDTDKLVNTTIDHIIQLATSLKTSDKENFSKNIYNILNHISLVQDITQIDNEESLQMPEKSIPEPMSLEIKEEIIAQNENLEDLVIENLKKEISSESLVVDGSEMGMEVDVVEESVQSEVPQDTQEDSMIIDPVRLHIESLEKFSKSVNETATEWCITKETNLTKIREVLKESDKKWRQLMMKFECPRDVTDVGTEVDPKMFAKQNRQAKKDILGYMTESESEAEDYDNELSSDNEIRQNIIDMVEASYSDALDSEIEEECGKKRLLPKSPGKQLPEIAPTKKDSDDEDNSESDSDASIDRLCNLSNLARRNKDNDRKNDRPAPFLKKQAPKKALNVAELVNGAADVHGEDSEEETLLPMTKAPATEAEYLKKINEEIKRQLLESSDSDLDDDESAISVNSEAHDSESSDDSDSSIIMDRFLSSLDQNQRNSNKDKLPSIDSGLEEKSPPPKKSNNRRRSSVIDREPLNTPDGSKDDDDDALDLSMFKVATEKVKESEALAELDADLEPDTTTKVPNVEDYISLSSESDNESTNEAPVRSRNTRKIMSEADLASETKAAQEAEVKRAKRLEKMSQSMTQLLSQRPDLEEEFVLDYDKKNDEPITVHPDIVRKLKPHQKDGVRFMYNNCYGPIDDIEKYPGSGCILAHCMGLGKTLQLIALLHTIIRYPRLKTNKILVLCPKSTIMNWFEEFERWIASIKKTRKMKVFCYEENMTIKEKTKILSEWYSCGIVKKDTPSQQDTWLGKTNAGQAGCLLLGYETFRSLVNYNPRRKNARQMDDREAKYIESTIEKCLIEPGADLVVCDEGHVIKNSKSGISKAVSQITTKRRIILTGTPIQNNLNEYYCMVNWIKPSFLGTEKEFNNRYANPIKQGQHKDSTSSEIRQMKRRSFVLHRKLQPFVERKEFTILKDELPTKHEYVIYVPLTEVQKKLYKMYLDKLKSDLGESDKIKGNHLLPDYTYLRKIWTHPRVLESAFESSRKNQTKKTTKMFEKNLDKLLERCDEEDLPDDVFDIGGSKSGIPDKWWERFVTPNDLETLISSYKLQIMVEILRQCEELGDKCLIFSNFVAVLTVVEHFLKTQMGYQPGTHYYRLDGQTPKQKRHTMITRFNRADNMDVKCFLISARAGGQGINLIGANRVIILDTSWNPAADLQSIFRVYRLGQKKTCYVYRLLAMGTMEEKVYSRSVTKQAMSNRVVDEMTVDRHFSYGELAELYTLTEYDAESRPVPGIPVDSILITMLRLFPHLIYKFHEHDSLLASNDDEELSELEKAEAWKALEDEEKAQNNPNRYNLNAMQGMPMSPYANNYLGQYYGNLPNMPNMNSMISQLMYNMSSDPYYGLHFPGMPPRDMPSTSTNPYSDLTSPLLAMRSLADPMSNLSGGGISSAGGSSLFESLYRSPSSTTGPSSMFNPAPDSPSTSDLIAGMRQRNSNNFGGVNTARSHPMNGVARTSLLKNPTPPSDPVPIRLTPTAELLRKSHSLPKPSSPTSSGSVTKRSTPQPQAARPKSVTTKHAFEEQYKKHFENKNLPPVSSSAQAATMKRKEIPSTSNVIEIDDDEVTVTSSRIPAPKPATKPRSTNMGISYAEKQPKGTPVYLPDLPEGTSINKIPKKPAEEPKVVSSQAPKPATITNVARKPVVYRLPKGDTSVVRSPTSVVAPPKPPQTTSTSQITQRPSISTGSVRAVTSTQPTKPPNIIKTATKLSARGIEVLKAAMKPSQGVQNIGNVTIIPASRASKSQTAVPSAAAATTAKPLRPVQSQPPPRIVSVSSLGQAAAAASSSSVAPSSIVVKKAVQQITKNSHGNTSITPIVARQASAIPTVQVQGWKRKDPPINASTSQPPAKMIRINPSQIVTKK
ncbi:transcriptional regulator ATRX-like [Culicoides brevitarsis]|uniref:transcriptional regulator ATRX-like n=1 Tax=Culicoides brevitarsis TaxID=469753 RepID=UPI00307B27F0